MDAEEFRALSQYSGLGTVVAEHLGEWCRLLLRSKVTCSAGNLMDVC